MAEPIAGPKQRITRVRVRPPGTAEIIYLEDKRSVNKAGIPVTEEAGAIVGSIRTENKDFQDLMGEIREEGREGAGTSLQIDPEAAYRKYWEVTRRIAKERDSN